MGAGGALVILTIVMMVLFAVSIYITAKRRDAA